jgi:hypothetical protein
MKNFQYFFFKWFTYVIVFTSMFGCQFCKILTVIDPFRDTLLQLDIEASSLNAALI